MLNPNEITKGMTVRFTGKDGYPFQIQKAMEHLQVGEIYSVSNVYKDAWSCHIYLKGLQNRSFDAIMFEDTWTPPPKVREVVPPKQNKK